MEAICRYSRALLGVGASNKGGEGKTSYFAAL